MADYLWEEFDGVDWPERFPLNVVGGGEWRRQVLQPGLWIPPLLPVISPTLRPRPVLFVSHRSVDVNQAKRIAYLANQAGFDYWVDVFDPNLQRLVQATTTPTFALSAHQLAVAVSQVVDMALLNCTHLIAAITLNVQGSWWVPYEFGRAQDATMQWPACSWLHPAVPRTSIGDFLALKPIHPTEADIVAWLQAEFQCWVSQHGRPAAPAPWSHPPTTPL